MFLPGHRSLVAHAECAGTPRVMREAQMKTPNREQLGAEFWWCSLAFFQTRLRRRCMQVWKSAGFCQKCPQRFAANGTDSRQVGQHPALGFLCVQRLNQGPADMP